MKAIDVIEAMCFDSDLAESSSIWVFYNGDSEEKWIRRIFGDFHLKEGDVIPGYYLTIWQFDAMDLPFFSHKAPDVTLVRDNPEEADNDDQEIYLWRVEE